MRHAPARLRRGFTLIELLIVVAIIGLLLSIVGVVAMSSISSGRVAGTKALMTKIQRQLQSRAESVSRLCRSQRSKPQMSTDDSNGLAALLTPSNARTEQVRIALLTKIYLRNYLPQTWDEAKFLTDSSNYPPPIAGQRFPKSESAEVLYFFLNNSAIPGFTPANQDLFSGNEVRDTDNNGFLEIVDAWGEPVRFFRWPTRLLRPNGFSAAGVIGDDFSRAKILIEGIPNSVTSAPSTSVAGSSVQDPDDPFGVLKPGNGWLAVAGISTFENGTTAPAPFHTPFTWHSPLVVSAGPDREHGIYPINDTAHFGRLCEPYTTGPEQSYLDDNITTLNVKSGGN